MKRESTKREVVRESLISGDMSKDMLVSEIKAWARRIGVEDKIKEIHIRPMKRKWASVSTKGRLTFSTDLLKEPVYVRKEVIIHELVHLRLQNGSHGKLFRSLVKAYIASK